MHNDKNTSVQKLGRYEKKVIVQEPRHFDNVMSCIKRLGRHQFPHPTRVVNNLYLDTVNFDSYWANINGLSKRKKNRIRWYGENSFEAKYPMFEVKEKNGHIGQKISTPLPDFQFQQIDWSGYSSMILETDIGDKLRPSLLRVYPSLLNSYKRSYLTVLNGRLRVTIDTELCYYRTEPTMSVSKFPKRENQKTVFEFKFASDVSDLIRDFFYYLPVRFTRHSKYITGIQLTRSEFSED